MYFENSEIFFKKIDSGRCTGNSQILQHEVFLYAQCNENNGNFKQLPVIQEVEDNFVILNRTHI